MNRSKLFANAASRQWPQRSSNRFVSIFLINQVCIGSESLKEEAHMADKKTAIVTGASRGIGAGLVEAFLKEGYNVVATSRHVSQSLTASPRLVLVDGDIGKQETGAKTVEAAIKHFGTIDVLVNNAGIYRAKPFTEFTYRGLQCPGVDQSTGHPLHHPAHCEADAETEIWKRCDYLCIFCRSANRRRQWLSFDDYERGP
jgi:short subunit dehydrogenase